jgi:hypothetical protein
MGAAGLYALTATVLAELLRPTPPLPLATLKPVLPLIERLLRSPVELVQEAACWAASHLVAVGSREYTEACEQAGIVTELLGLLRSSVDDMAATAAVPGVHQRQQSRRQPRSGVDQSPFAPRDAIPPPGVLLPILRVVATYTMSDSVAESQKLLDGGVLPLVSQALDLVAPIYPGCPLELPLPVLRVYREALLLAANVAAGPVRHKLALLDTHILFHAFRGTLVHCNKVMLDSFRLIANAASLAVADGASARDAAADNRAVARKLLTLATTYVSPLPTPPPPADVSPHAGAKTARTSAAAPAALKTGGAPALKLLVLRGRQALAAPPAAINANVLCALVEALGAMLQLGGIAGSNVDGGAASTARECRESYWQAYAALARDMRGFGHRDVAAAARAVCDANGI